MRYSGTPTESRHLLSILDELDSHAFPNGGVGLLGLDANLLEHDALGVGRTTEWRRLEGRSQSSLLEGKIGPLLVSSVVSQLASGVKATRLSFTHDCYGGRLSVKLGRKMEQHSTINGTSMTL